ncbi:ABC transporter substrate-binding protein [Thiomicrorhabdus xiamenensis]|uniref:ABC transporter substrate-binding protein n=1 Tax=Thiomicrorhabdus xiamenensis TaxID=2739063 RepID=A0A7D4NZJ6_9GAMM|nr:ABC transporter substrate-binding protein [Thiomicrorhabdus xiamenensis]QKI89798.1 ABC transporter substrate-binding protein [Thiomicrorhabdus xiamenensis]
MGLFLGTPAFGAQTAQQTPEKCAIEAEPARVYGANPIVTYLLVAMAPEKLIGWNFPPAPQAKHVFADELMHKPIIGGWFGQGRTPNMEVLLASKPDLIVMSGAMVHAKRQAMLGKLGIPVCNLRLDTLEDYPQDLRNLGKWLGKTERGEMLAQKFEQLLQRQKRLKALLQQRNVTPKTVYYAEAPNGLATECRGSIHAETLPWAGALNPHRCPADQGKYSRYGKVEINIEQLLKYNPDAIVTQEKIFYDKVYLMPTWQGLSAIQNKQVFLAPQTPFRWLDRPPSFMRILAAQWLMQKLYPQVREVAELDTVAETQEIFQLFFQTDLSRAQAQSILQGKTL